MLETRNYLMFKPASYFFSFTLHSSYQHNMPTFDFWPCFTQYYPITLPFSKNLFLRTSSFLSICPCKVALSNEHSASFQILPWCTSTFPSDTVVLIPWPPALLKEKEIEHSSRFRIFFCYVLLDSFCFFLLNVLTLC